MTNFYKTMILAFAVALTGACDAEQPDFELDEAGETALRPGGWQFNTNYAGPHAIDHFNLSGTPHNGIVLWDISHENGVDPFEFVDTTTIQVIDGEMIAQRYDGIWLSHADWADTIWHVHIQGAGDIDVTMTPTFVTQYNEEKKPYYELYWNFPEENPIPSCPKDADDPLDATVYRGIEVDYQTGEVLDNTEMLYFGCRAGAVGKAFWWGLGYHELEAYDPAQALENFTAAIRMIRADILGDAGSFTAPGNAVAPLDHFGIIPSTPVGSVDEAVWDEDGAICADSARDGTALGSISGAPPTCSSLGGAQHVFETDGNARFMTRVPPPPPADVDAVPLPPPALTF